MKKWSSSPMKVKAMMMMNWEMNFIFGVGVI